MNLYLLTQQEATGYDTCPSLVVTADTEEKARMIHPCMVETLSSWTGWNDDFTKEDLWGSRIWAKSPNDAKVRLLGIANSELKNNSIIQYCFHAG